MYMNIKLDLQFYLKFVRTSPPTETYLGTQGDKILTLNILSAAIDGVPAILWRHKSFKTYLKQTVQDIIVLFIGNNWRKTIRMNSTLPYSSK